MNFTALIIPAFLPLAARAVFEWEPGTQLPAAPGGYMSGSDHNICYYLKSCGISKLDGADRTLTSGNAGGQNSLTGNRDNYIGCAAKTSCVSAAKPC